MPFLSPVKVLVILVVALIVLGPDKLPQVARQLGALWGDFRRFRERLEHDVRGSFPDLPSTDRITQAVRSPIAFLDGLADVHGGPVSEERNGDGIDSQPGTGTDGDPAGAPPAGETAAPPVAVNGHGAADVTGATPAAPAADPPVVRHAVRLTAPPPDDPAMN